MDETILRGKFEDDQREAAYRAWLDDKEFSARYAAESALPPEEIAFAARYAIEQADQIREELDADRKKLAKALAELRAELSKEIASAGESSKAERSAELSKALTTLAGKLDLKIGRVAASIGAEHGDLANRVKVVESIPRVVQQIAPPKIMAKTWQFAVTSRTNGLIDTVIAAADGKPKFRFTVKRTPDNFPETLTMTRLG